MNKYDKKTLKTWIKTAFNRIINVILFLFILFVVVFTVFTIMIGDGKIVLCEDNDCEMHYANDRRTP